MLPYLSGVELCGYWQQFLVMTHWLSCLAVDISLISLNSFIQLIASLILTYSIQSLCIRADIAVQCTCAYYQYIENTHTYPTVWEFPPSSNAQDHCPCDTPNRTENNHLSYPPHNQTCSLSTLVISQLYPTWISARRRGRSFSWAKVALESPQCDRLSLAIMLRRMCAD